MGSPTDRVRGGTYQRSGEVYLLPPRPRPVDWLVAGAGAGLALGLAELAVALPGGESLSARLALVVLGVEAAVVGAGSALAGGVLWARRVRPSRSELVGAVVGPMLFAAISGLFFRQLTAGPLPGSLEFSGLMTAALLAMAAGLAAYRTCGALERSGVVVSAPYVWGAVALLVATSERLAWESSLPGVWSGIIAIALVLVVVASAWAVTQMARRRGSRPSRSFGWLLGWLVVISLGSAYGPSALPWLFYERDMPAIGAGPPNFLVVEFPDTGSDSAAAPDFEGATPNLELLAFDALTYDRLIPETASGARALLSDRAGNALVSELLAAGYATAAILPGGLAPPELSAAEVNARPGARAQLEGELAWLAAAPLLVGTGSPLLGFLGLDAVARSADQVADESKRWLLDWRMTRAPAPFFLFIDVRGVAPPGGDEALVERSDACLGDLLEHLRMLDVEDSTLVLVLRETVARNEAGAHLLSAVLRTPGAARGSQRRSGERHRRRQSQRWSNASGAAWITRSVIALGVVGVR